MDNKISNCPACGNSTGAHKKGCLNWNGQMAEAYAAGFNGEEYSGDFTACYNQGKQHREKATERA